MNTSPELWKQIGRTVNGEPVGQDQIDMIVAKIRQSLDLQPHDTLLDIGCGNGALTQYFFNDVRHATGIDSNPDYIETAINVIARGNAKVNSFFLWSGAADYLKNPFTDDDTKALCYGAFMFLPNIEAWYVLDTLFNQSHRVERVFIGNLPDRDKAHLFVDAGFGERYDDHTHATGIWRTQEEFRALAEGCGWKCEFSTMPPEFYGGHYRYDALLTR